MIPFNLGIYFINLIPIRGLFKETKKIKEKYPNNVPSIICLPFNINKMHNEKITVKNNLFRDAAGIN